MVPKIFGQSEQALQSQIRLLHRSSLIWVSAMFANKFWQHSLKGQVELSNFEMEGSIAKLVKVSECKRLIFRINI